MGFEADVGLVLGDTDETGLVQIGLTRHKVVTMVHKSHPFFKKNIISLSDLQNEKIVTLNKDYRVNEEFHSKCAELGFSPTVVAETVDTNCLYKLCKLAVGVGILIDCSVDHFEMGDLKIIPFQEEFTWDIFALIQQQNIKFPLIQAFQAHLRDYDFQSKRSV